MKRIYFLFTVAMVVFVSGTAFVSFRYHTKSSNGLAGQTGSPGEGTCSGCHGGGSNATTVTINSDPAFIANEYVQGQTYTITVTVGGTGYSKFGFGCEILHLGNNQNAGVMSNPGSGVQLVNGPGGRKNALQSTPKTGVNTADFSFEWTAPTNGNGCRIYVVGNCVNNDGSTTGDFARATSLTLTTPTVAAVAEQRTDVIKALKLFPNPIIDQINVSYALFDDKQIKIELLSISGSVVAELLNEEQHNGYHTKKLVIPSEVASGVYFLKVIADNKPVAQRLVSVR